MSPSLPFSGIAIVMVTKNAEITQLMCSTPPSSPTIVGMAVAKIICPSELISMVSRRAENTSFTLGAAG